MTARLAAIAIFVSAEAAADPIQLRADALATTAAPAGLVTLQAVGDAGPGLSAEAVVWTGGGTVGDSARADVLVIALRARTPGNRASARIGRFVAALGALRPVQIDGVDGRARLAYGIDAETFGGIPVARGSFRRPRVGRAGAGLEGRRPAPHGGNHLVSPPDFARRLELAMAYFAGSHGRSRPPGTLAGGAPTIHG